MGSTLSRNIRRAAATHELDASYQELKECPVGIFGISGLEVLNLAGNHLRVVPNELGNATSLVALDLDGNELVTVPETIVKLTELQSLNLRLNRCPIVPTPVVSLVSLIKLDLSNNNKLVSLPNAIKALVKLTELRVSNNKLTALPATLAQLPLRVLEVHHNPFGTMPPVLAQFKELEELSLDGCELTSLDPATLIALAADTKLRMLNLTNNKLKEIPDDISELRELDICDNPIIKLSPRVRQTPGAENDMETERLAFLKSHAPSPRV